MILFLMQFVLTNIVFSFIICVGLVRLDKKRTYSSFELLLYALGLGPIFTTLLLYYFLLLMPFRSNLFYFVAVIVVYVLLIIIGRKGFSIIWFDLINGIKYFKKFLHFSLFQRNRELTIFICAVILLAVIFLFIFFPNTTRAPLTGTDALKYGNIGKIIFKEKSLAYRWISPYPNSGYYFQTNHAPSYSLLLTWNRILGSFFKSDNDFFYKSVTSYYSLLLTALLLFWISKKSKYLAILGVFTFLAGFSFSHNMISNHLDLYRIFFLVLSWIFLAYVIEKKDALSFFLLGVFSGFAAFSHTIGAVLVIFNCLALFFFLKGSLKLKMVKTTNVLILTIIFGWFHYIIDTIWGFGWIIFYRGITYWG